MSHSGLTYKTIAAGLVTDLGSGSLSPHLAVSDPEFHPHTAKRKKISKIKLWVVVCASV